MGRRVNTAVWMEKYNRWQIKVQKDGERKTFYSSTPGRKGKRECNSKADAWLDDNILEPDNRVEVLFEEWLEELKATTGSGNYQNNETYWNTWIKPGIGRKKIMDVTEQHLQSIINRAYATGRSKKHLENIRACLTAFMKYCRKCRVTNLIVENVSIPRNAPVGERVILQPDDIAILFTSNKTTRYGKELCEPYINAYRFEVATGMRPGEILGIKWIDIEDERLVHLKRSINVSKEFTKGKNKNAQRTFAITPIGSKILKDQRAWLLATGIRSEYVFPNPDGSHAYYQQYYDHWNRYRDYNNLAKVTPYELRHTFVSIVKDMPEGLLKPLVGHSVDMDTYKTYSHEINGDLERAADMVQAIFSKMLDHKKDEKTAEASG